MTFTVTILGSSSATPTSYRNPSSLLVNMNHKYFLVDCGEGTQMQLRRYKIKIQKIRHIFISHLHGDHFFGLIGLMSTFHLLGREEELHIYANPELQMVIDMQLKISATSLDYPVIYHPTSPEKSEVIYEDDRNVVKTFPLIHTVPTTGFLFYEKHRMKKIKKEFLQKEDVPIEMILKIKEGADYVTVDGKLFKNESITISPPPPRSFAYCSDTAYNEGMIEYIRNSNLIYHEATFMEDMKAVAATKQHSTAAQAAEIAKLANVDKLVIGHFSARYKELDKLYAEARDIFPETQLAGDGEIFKVGGYQ